MAKPKQTKEQRFVELSWRLLELKLSYYYPAVIHESRKKEVSIPDQAYDALADEYRKLAKELGLPASADDMVGFDFDRPSCSLVAGHLRSPKP